MRVLATDPYLTPEQFAERGAEPRALDDLLRESDYVSVHVPLSGETTKMLGEREFRLMRPHAIFVITARGGVVDEGALARVLVEGGIAGAGLDVWRPEPPALDNPSPCRTSSRLVAEGRVAQKVAAASGWVWVVGPDGKCLRQHSFLCFDQVTIVDLRAHSTEPNRNTGSFAVSPRWQIFRRSRRSQT